MKKNNILLLCLYTMSTAYASPICFSRFDSICAHIAKNQTLRAAGKVIYWGTISCVTYAAARYLNGRRNTSRSSTNTFIKNIGRPATFKLSTSGVVIIRGDSSIQEPHIEHELMHPAAAQPHLTIWERILRWLIAPAHKGFDLHRVTVPANTNIEVTAEHAYDFDHNYMPAADIAGIIGKITVYSNTGNILIKDPTKEVIASTEDAITIANFSGNVTIPQCGSLRATREEDSTASVTVCGRSLAKQDSYEITDPFIPV